MSSISKIIAVVVIITAINIPDLLAQKSSQCLAVITGLKGSVMIKQSGQKDYSKATWGTQLFQGDKVKTGPESQASLTLTDGSIMEIYAGSEGAISGKSGAATVPGNVRKVTSAMIVDLSTLAAKKEAKADAGTLAGLRAGGSEELIELCSPFNTLIKSGKPTFSWTSKKPYEKYVVNLYSSKGLVWSRKASATNLPFPDNQAALEPGETYFWNVEGEDLLENVKSGNLKFSVLPDLKLKEVTGQEELIRKTFANDPGNSTFHSILGTYYRSQGLLQDAITEFEIIASVYPDAALPHEILGSLYSDTGNKDKAIEELQKALALSKTGE
jgi:hypothetical protein